MSGGTGLQVADLTADDIERLLDAGETIEVFMRPRQGLQPVAGGLIMFTAFSLIAWWAHGEVGDFAWFQFVMGLPFLALVPVGLARVLNPPKAFELTPAGIDSFVRPWSRDHFRWQDIRDLDVRSGMVRLDLDDSVKIDRSWMERLSRVHSRIFGSEELNLIALPTRNTELDGEVLLEFLERRVRRTMLLEPVEPDGTPAGP